MADPKLEEFCRVRGLGDCKPGFFRQMQDYARDVLQPALTEREQLIEENAALTAEIAKLKGKTKREPVSA